MPKDISFDQTLQAGNGKAVVLPNGDSIAHAAFAREGADLFLSSPGGHTVKVEGYFAHDPAPDLVTADGAELSPDMVNAFLPALHPDEYAAATPAAGAAAPAAADGTPVGKVTQVTGSATIIHTDGTHVKAVVGLAVHQGDVVQTTAKGAVDILFSDNTTFAVSENARLSIDQYSYNSAEHSGTSFFSMLHGVFVYTSGLIGKDDPGSVHIETPVGSIGIRGTVIAGDINPAGQASTVTVVDGSIVVANGGGTLQMSTPLDTASLTSYGTAATDTGAMTAHAFSSAYSAVAPVAGATFDAVGALAPPAPAVPAPETAPQTVPDGTLLHQSSLPSGTVPTPAAPAAAVTFAATETTSFTTPSTEAPTAAGTGSTPLALSAPGASSSTLAPATGDAAGAAAPGSVATGGAAAPSVSFTFDPLYISGLTGHAANSLPLLGLGYTDPVGTVHYSGFPAGDTISLSIASGGTGDILQYSNPYPGTFTTQMSSVAAPIFQITGSTLTIANPLGLIGGSYTVAIDATDNQTGKVVSSGSISVNVEDAGYDVFYIGNHTVNGTAINPAGSSTVDNISGGGGVEVLIGRSSGTDTLLGGTGHDIMIETGAASSTMAEGAGGHAQMFGGAGNGTFTFEDNTFLGGPSGGGDGFSLVAGGTGTNTLQLGNSGVVPQVFDFTASNQVTNVQTLSLSSSLTAGAGQTVNLNLQDILEMTGATHTLTIGELTANDLSHVDLAVGGASYTVNGSFGSGTTDLVAGSGGGTETITATTNGQSVTLVIETGTSTVHGISVHIH